VRATTIVLARHGVTAWSEEGRWQGHADLPLNEHGREQARALAADLEAVPFAAIYASDLRRAYETAVVVAERRRLPVTPLRELREVDVGSWTGRSRADVQARFPDAFAAFKARTGRGWEGGETYVELGRRVLHALRRIARAHTGETLLVVTHSEPIRAVHAHAAGLDFATDRTAAAPVAHASFSVVTAADGVFRLAEADRELAGAVRAK
jgi:broad specificity phosphatase PhoE